MSKYKEAILYAVVIVLGFIFLLSKIVPKVVDIVKMEFQLKEKNAKIESLKQEIVQLEEYEKIKENSTTKTKKVYTPSEQSDSVELSFASLLDDIVNITKYNNVKVFSVQYTYNPPEDKFVSQSNGHYDACRLDFELISDYQSFRNLLIELIKYPYFLNINNFKVIPYQKDKKILLIQLQLTLYVQKTGAPNDNQVQQVQENKGIFNFGGGSKKDE